MCNLLGRLQVVAYISPFQGSTAGSALFPGRCPGLRYHGPLGLRARPEAAPSQAGRVVGRDRRDAEPDSKACGAKAHWRSAEGRGVRPEGPGYLSPAQRAGNIFNQTACGLKGRDTSLTKTACGAMGDALISANHAPISISNSCSSHLQHKK